MFKIIYIVNFCESIIICPKMKKNFLLSTFCKKILDIKASFTPQNEMKNQLKNAFPIFKQKITIN